MRKPLSAKKTSTPRNPPPAPGEVQVVGEHGEHGHTAHAVEPGRVRHARDGPGRAHASGTRPHRHVHAPHPRAMRVARSSVSVAPIPRGVSTQTGSSGAGSPSAARITGGISRLPEPSAAITT